MDHEIFNAIKQARHAEHTHPPLPKHTYAQAPRITKGSPSGIIHCLVDNGETNLQNNELLFRELTDLLHLKPNLWDLMFFTVAAAEMFILGSRYFCFKVNSSPQAQEEWRRK